MSPCLTSNYPANHLECHSISECYRSLYFSCFNEGSYNKYIFFSEFRLRMFAADWIRLWQSLPASISSFACSILHILKLISKKPVVWSHARGIVALVTHTNTIGYRPVKKLPPDPVSQSVYVLISTPDLYSTIPVCILVRGPDPATIRSDIYMAHEPRQSGCLVFAHSIANIAQLGVDYIPSGGQ